MAVMWVLSYFVGLVVAFASLHPSGYLVGAVLYAPLKSRTALYLAYLAHVMCLIIASSKIVFLGIPVSYFWICTLPLFLFLLLLLLFFGQGTWLLEVYSFLGASYPLSCIWGWITLFAMPLGYILSFHILSKWFPTVLQSLLGRASSVQRRVCVYLQPGISGPSLSIS